MTEDLRTSLQAIAAPIQAPAGMARTALRSTAARRRRHQAAAGSVLIAGGVLVATTVRSHAPTATDKVTVGAGPTSSARGTMAGTATVDMVDGVAIRGLPDGWEPVDSVAPHSRPYEGGTRTRHDLYVPNPAFLDGGQIITVEVFRGTVGQVALRTAVILGALPGEVKVFRRTPGNTLQQGILFHPGERPGVDKGRDHAVGYKQLDGDKQFLLVRAPERLLPAILDRSS